MPTTKDALALVAKRFDSIEAAFRFSSSSGRIEQSCSGIEKAGDRDSGRKCFETLEQETSSWPGASAHPHRFGGREFRFNAAEIGHIYIGGTVDIPFPRSVRDALLAEGLAQEHRWVPDSGWITFQIRGEEDFKHAIWLLRLSYLRYALKTTSDPRRCLNEYSEELELSPQFRSLLESFLPRPTAA